MSVALKRRWGRNMARSRTEDAHERRGRTVRLSRGFLVLLAVGAALFSTIAAPAASALPPTYQSSFGSAGNASGQFAHPAGIAQVLSGNIWVVDENNNRLEKFNEAGEYKFKMGALGTGNGQFTRPTDVATDSSDNMWVADAGNTRVQKFNASGEFVKAFGSAGTGNGQFGANGPEALALDGKGNLWVTDTVNGRLEKFNENGEFVKAISSKGSAAGQLGKPTGIDIGLNGNI